MLDSVYQVVFRVHCTACGQTLDAVPSIDGVEYKHGNADDCDQPSVTLPAISPEQVSTLFSPKK